MFQALTQEALLLTLTLVLAAAKAATPNQATVVEGRVVAIADGDTLTVLDVHKQQHKIRLAEIDAPEKGQDFGQRSRQNLSDLCFHKHARVRVVDVDRYQRIVGRVECDGKDANLAQVIAGLAWVYEGYAKDVDLKKAQETARLNKVGLWSQPNPTPPWEFRKTSR